MAFSIILGTVAIYLALFFHVAFKPKISRKLIAGAAGFSIVVGLIFYGYCFSTIEGPWLLSVLKTCSAVCKLFVGEGSADAIEASPLVKYTFVQIVFSILSFLGIFTTTGAAVSAIGAGFLRQARLFFQRNKDLAVITPLNNNTLAFARELTEQCNNSVVFVDKTPGADCIAAANALGCVVRSDSAALSPEAAFLRSIGITASARKIRLFVLSSDRYENRKYAEAFRNALLQHGVSPAQTSLTIFAEEDTTENAFSQGENRYGNVLCVNEEYLAARLLLRQAPLYDTVSFDENGRAREDFHALVVGSGKVGQAVIKQIVMNGQFYGSQFRLSIFDPAYDKVAGRLRYECSQLFDNYPIDVFHADARSLEMFSFLSQYWDKLNYIVISTGNDQTNLEVCQQVRHFLQMRKREMPIYICSTRGLQRVCADTVIKWNIFSRHVLCSDEIDRKAMLLNHRYRGGASVQEDWDQCDYFSRMSSRASADYAPVFLKMAGLSADAVPKGNWVSGTLLENMAIAEHERWCAFHYCMGFRPMTDQEFAQRSEIYLREKAKDPRTDYRISKDLSARIHCCLIPWDALDALSAKEEAVTGKKTDYKQMDRNNVLTLPELLKG